MKKTLGKIFTPAGLRFSRRDLLTTALILLGLPMIVALIHYLSERKRKSNETDL